MAVTPSTPSYPFRRSLEVISMPTPASTMINPGDLLWQNAGVVAIASAFTWDTNLATTQPEFRLKFLGVALDQKLASDASTRAIRIQTKGVFAYPCAALGGAQHVGAFVNCAKDANNNSLADQILAIVASFGLSIGTLAAEAVTGDTTLLVYLQSFLLVTNNGTAS